ncbi:MAG: hypothetical protein ACFFD4_08170 [Candidatus Odinarchaeota archaeon]
MNFVQKYQGIIIAVIILIGIVAGAYIFVNSEQFSTTPPDDEGTPVGDLEVTAKWKWQCKDLLNEGGAAASGTLAIYDPAEPGVALESSLSISSGAFTSGNSYTSGRKLFLKYTDTTYFDYGILVDIPYWNTEYDSVQTLDHPDIIWVIKMGDVAQGASNTDFDILKDGAAAWDDSSAVTSKFNRTLDGNNPKLGVMLTNEDTDTSFIDPRGYYDYSQDAESLRDRKSYLIIEFQPTGTTTSGVNANDYLRFSTVPANMIKRSAGTSMVLFFPMTDMDAGYMKDLDLDSQVVGGRDGNEIIAEVTFDFSGSIASAIGDDDIDIEVSCSTGFPMDWFESHETLSSVPGDDPFGEMNTAWTNDCSIGW